MGKSLREALVEQLAALRAHGLAPEVLPDGEEAEPVLPTNGYEADRPRRLGKRALAKRQGPRPSARVATARPAPLAGAKTEPAAPKPAVRPPSIGKMLERRAEQRRVEQRQRDELREALSSLRGGSEVDEQAVNSFAKKLEHETGALPPLDVVLEAMRDAGSDDPRAVADAVRRYYRRPRVAR